MRLRCIICIVIKVEFRALKIETIMSILQALRMPTSPRNATSPMISVHGLVLSNTMTTLKITICRLDAETRKGISLDEEIKK